MKGITRMIEEDLMWLEYQKTHFQETQALLEELITKRCLPKGPDSRAIKAAIFADPEIVKLMNYLGISDVEISG
jgi:hypothetical protein